MNTPNFFSTVPSTYEHIEGNLRILRVENVDSYSKFNMDLFKDTVKGIYEKFAAFEFREGFAGIFSWYDSLSNVSMDSINRSYFTMNDKVKDLQKKHPRLNFVLHSNAIVPCPDGFQGEWTAYNQMLVQHRKELIETALGALDSYHTYITSFLSDRNSRIALQDNSKQYAVMAKQREVQTKAFESFFSSKGYNQRMTLDRMFHSTDDIHHGLRVSMDHWNYVREVDLKGLRTKVELLAQRINALIDRYENHRELEVSKQALLNIAEGSYETACQIEMLALYVARSEMAMTTSGNIATKLLTFK